MAYYSARNDYILICELPAGKGFADMVFVPRKHMANKPALIELKWNQSPSEGAIAQIKKQYVKALDGYHGEIWAVGINYDKESKTHQCEIEKISKITFKSQVRNQSLHLAFSMLKINLIMYRVGKYSNVGLNFVGFSVFMI